MRNCSYRQGEGRFMYGMAWDHAGPLAGYAYRALFAIARDVFQNVAHVTSDDLAKGV